MNATLHGRARPIRLLTCDVDGVLTDGKIYTNHDGQEFKAFSVLDGVGLKRLAEIGVAIGWITGSRASAVVHRARALGIAHVLLGIEDKLAAWEQLRAGHGLETMQCAHIGDDIPDLPVLVRCGLSATVPHAPHEVQAASHFVTHREGGAGAVRELCDLILLAQGAAPRSAISEA
jgi:3-deoxy-D-manno-octulosonate 8-phosphate phosphatase (KDO 8-P phosphatase)